MECIKLPKYTLPRLHLLLQHTYIHDVVIQHRQEQGGAISQVCPFHLSWLLRRRSTIDAVAFMQPGFTTVQM
jgi:hypothetical protein